jgi:uncharacterized membrane protein YdjX (TVP38/TMEM64 family)
MAWPRLFRLKLGFAVLVLLLLASLALFLPIDRLLEAFKGWSEQAGPVAFLAYVLLFVGVVLVCLPAAPFSLGAGFLFGLAGGLPIAFASIAAAASIAFVIGRRMARERIRQWAATSRKLTAIDAALCSDCWKIIALLRMNPVLPFGPCNYACGATSMRYRPYLFGTMLGMLPDILVYVALGSAGHLLMDSDAKASPYRWALLALGLAATALATVMIARAARRALARTGMEESRGAA